MLRHLRLLKDLIKGKPAHLRSPHWGKVRKEHLKKEPVCQWCGGKKRLQVHHIIPFHVNPAKELDPRNLITLCEKKGLDCHLEKGHLGNFRQFDLYVRQRCIEHQKQLREGVQDHERSAA